MSTIRIQSFEKSKFEQLFALTNLFLAKKDLNAELDFNPGLIRAEDFDRILAQLVNQGNKSGRLYFSLAQLIK